MFNVLSSGAATMQTAGKVRITAGEGESEDEIFKFLQESFFHDEPMNSALKEMPKKEDFGPLTYLKSGYSLAAYVRNIDGEERLAGVVLNRVRRRNEENKIQPNTESIAVLFNFLSKLEEKTDIWSRITSDKIFYTVILSVGREYRGLKIAQKLMEASLKKATSDGLTYAAVKCSSYYSARIMMRLHYEKIGEIRYDDYRDENGEVLMRVDKPHEAIIKYLKKL